MFMTQARLFAAVQKGLIVFFLFNDELANLEGHDGKKKGPSRLY
jgi:hypothetical protein